MANLIRIGNGRGVRIPAQLIKLAGLDAGELTFKVIEGGLLIEAKPTGKRAREGWDTAFSEALSGQSHALSQEEGEWLEADLIADE